MIRIQSGRLKGRSLPLPDPGKVRPTTGKVRSAIFNMLQTDLPGSLFWDLFAGSGAVGLEAYSRGAEKVLFLEKDPELVRRLAAWIGKEIPGSSDAFEIVSGEILPFLKTPSPNPLPGILFLDPPYGYADWPTLLKTLHENGILDHNFIMVLEYHRKDSLPWEFLPDWGCRILSHHIYGESGVSLLLPSVR
ncbi:MAG: 16S rRNA (guanine(966)-N(2))-methyltransferase RsmD [Leptospirillia bacterium]